jgi:glycosyltransferase involved in cell wall biosynthesis
MGDRRSVLVLSHLYPNARRPYLGLFVARQVHALRESHDIAVLAPTRWLPPLTGSWRRERDLPRREVVDGTPVFRPRTAQLPFGLIAAETLMLPVALGRAMRNVGRERNIDLVHAHFGLPDAWGGARIASRLHVPLVVSLWGSDVLVLARGLTLRRMLSSALTRAAHVIAPSRDLADRALELGAQPRRTVVVMGGVPDDYGLLSHADARAALTLPPTTRLVVWVGGLVQVKRPLLALQAISLIAARNPDVRLAVVGDGPMLREVHETVTQLHIEHIVRVLGTLEAAEVAMWQAAADVALNTSSSEGLPFALCEALVSGTRVAAVPIGGIPELLTATSGGTLAADSSPEALADTIEQELRLPRDPELAERAAFLRLSSVAPRIADIYARSI